MAIHHRKRSTSKSECFSITSCGSHYPPRDDHKGRYHRPTPAPPLPLEETGGVHKAKLKPNHHVALIVVLLLCALAAAFLFLSYLTIRKRNSDNPIPRRRRNEQRLDENRRDLLDEDQGPVLDHPIWYIRTVGLQQSVIESIAIIKYKREEGLIDGSDCSVCLSEFQEDESLRLLPKCSHAFHVHCIDTWLRSHENCPLCRASIVSDDNNHDRRLRESEQPREETQVENLENNGGLVSIQDGEEHGTDGFGFGAEGNLRSIPGEGERMSGVSNKEDSRRFNLRNRETRVQSDLDDHRRSALGEAGEEEEELEPVRRRSVSLDSSSASRVYLAMAKIAESEPEGCSRAQSSGEANKKKKASLVMEGEGNQRQGKEKSSRMTKTYSLGRLFLHRGAVVGLKRSSSSSSSGGMLSLPSRHTRSQDSILPL